jgi:hypothetical protein
MKGNSGSGAAAAEAEKAMAPIVSAPSAAATRRECFYFIQTSRILQRPHNFVVQAF